MNKKQVILLAVALIIIAAVFILFVAPPSWRAQKSAPKRIAMLTNSDLQLAAFDGIKAGLKELNLVENVDYIIDLKNPKGDRDLTKKMAVDIVSSKPDLIIPISTTATSAVLEADKEAKIPIVAVDVGNFKEVGINNIERPGGFLSAVIADNIATAPKRMEILKMLLPNMKRVGVLVNPNHVSYNEVVQYYTKSAKDLGIEINWYLVTKKEDLGLVMAKAAKDKPDGFMITAEATISGNSALIAPVLKNAKISSIDFNVERGVSSGYLMVYGSARYDIGKQGARMIEKVLHGQNPGDLPVEFVSPASFEINAKLAGEMGITPPKSLLLQATKVYNQ
ncbi:MAG: ABC transporter substrate-binding protein [Candidatus Giovannonibacteria bacterium]|nr:ABC transporter substrate-binding protein [Candidatus Giovannonibacteria bacterium]